VIASCRADDPAFYDALRGAGLPVGDLYGPAQRYFVMSEANRPVAFGGIAGDGTDRLLRSLVVVQTARGIGMGSRMIAALIDEARRDGATRLWLLTTDAADFFAGNGWRVADRADAPPAIATAPQFVSLCPATATLLVRELAE
jgi:amino-acid N-acetyltransferase